MPVKISSLFLLLGSMLICLNAISQNVVSGTVEANNRPMAFASVYFPSLEKGATTDENGKFRIENVPNGAYVLTASYTGYATQSRRLELAGGETSVSFALEEGNSLEEIVISGTMRPVSKLNSPVPVEVYSKAFFKKNPNPNKKNSPQE